MENFKSTSNPPTQGAASCPTTTNPPNHSSNPPNNAPSSTAVTKVPFNRCNPRANRPRCNQQPDRDGVDTQCWTEWFDRFDLPGKEDWEILDAVQNENPGRICNNPLQIEIRTKSTLSAAESEDVIAGDDKTICKNSKQTLYHQYSVRFMCPTDFCNQKVCWTKWFDRDNPSGIGDWELLSNLKKENPGEICERPLYIDVRTSDTNTPVTSTGQSIFIFSPTKGFVCRNRDQTGQRCHDYEVRFGCPCRCNSG
ncbi:uncharacterized protein LOC113135419 [Mastacembelus armatus]|nr:uncharacterized protein LOC113135419 [Mastacembelus armatus]